MSQVLIAIVDDDEPVRSMRRKRSCDLLATATFLRLARPIITDVQMPGLSGLDLQDRLIARAHCIPIISMTGYPDDNVRVRAMKAGAVCFLNKPISPDHFIGCIVKALKVT